MLTLKMEAVYENEYAAVITHETTKILQDLMLQDRQFTISQIVEDVGLL